VDRWSDSTTREVAKGSTRNSLLAGDGEWSLTLSTFSQTSGASAVAKKAAPRPATLALLSPASAGLTTPWPMATASTSTRATAPRSVPQVAAQNVAPCGWTPDSVNSVSTIPSAITNVAQLWSGTTSR